MRRKPKRCSRRPLTTRFILAGRRGPKEARAANSGPRDESGETAERLLRRVRRREIRAALLHVLGRRAGRLFVEAAGVAVPGLDAIAGAATVADFAAMTAEFTALQRDTDAALKFVGNGPHSLEQMRVSDSDESYSSFDEFKKIDLVKRFGPAGDGFEYHHIVEQNGRDDISESGLQSTNNIVRIPKLLHEEVSASFGRKDPDTGIVFRDSLKGKSFEERWDKGVKVLRAMSIIK